MHRAPCAASSSSGRRTRNSLNACSPSMRRAGSSYLIPERSILRKPPSSPIGAPLAIAVADDARLAAGVAARAAVGGRDERLVDLALRRDEALAARALRMVVVRLQRLALGLLGGGD